MTRATIREDSDGPPREVTTFKLRDEWVRLATVQKLPPMLRVVGVRLAHFRSGETGQLNPSYALLAAECGTTERTAQKAVAEYRKLGMIADTRVSGGRHDATNDFTLIIPYRRVFVRTPVKPKAGVSKRTPVKSKSGAHTGVRTGSGRVSRSVADGCPPVHPNSVMNSVRNSGRGKAARTADADRESATTNSATFNDATPNQRAVPALIETVTAQNQKPSRGNQEMGRPANGAAAVDAMRRAQFEDVRRLWPRVRVDEGKAFPAFLRVMAAGHSLQAVIDAVSLTLMAPGDVPWLSEALKLVERGQARSITGRQ